MDDNVVLIEIEETEKKIAQTAQVDVLAEQYEVETQTPEFDASSNDKMTMDEIVVGDITSNEAETVEIIVEEAVGWAGGDNSIHDNLAGRDEPDQHPITSITGLREELNQIEALQTVYSDKKQQADYYMWLQDAVPADPYGVFVSIYPNTDNIYSCNGDNDVFGVTVSDAAFVGGQEYVQAEGGSKTGRDGKYCAVVYSGMAAVRCETTVAVGDYVVSNIRGEAKKSDGDYGYLVTALSYINGENHAIISLSTPSTLLKTMSDGVQDCGKRILSAEHNITSVANVANSAYMLAKEAKENASIDAEYLEEQIAEVLGRMDGIDGENGIVDNLNQAIDAACKDAALAKVVANDAVSEARQIRDDAYASANEAIAAIKDIGAGSTSWAKRIDAYSVGEYSQAYGLTWEQAKSAIAVGLVHIPTITHTESYVGESTYEQEFSIGYYYEWNGERWVPSLSIAVNFSSIYMMGSSQTPYWVVTDSDVEYNGVIYSLGYLYKWENGQWNTTGVSIAENTLARAVSAMHQAANELSMEVSNVKGDVAALDIRVDENKSTVQSLASWAGQDGKCNLATIQQTADDGGARMALVVVQDGEDIELGGASIVLDDGEKGSYIQIDADNIHMDGYVTFENLSTEGQTEIAGGNIKTENLSAISANLGKVISGCIQSSEDFTSGFQPIEWDETIDLDGFEFMFHDGSSGRTLTVTKGPNKEIVTIPKECVGADGVVYKVVRIANQAFANLDKLQTVILHDEIIEIGSSAFSGSTLQSISIPSSVTLINPSIFKGCQNLQNVRLPVGITQIYYDAFTNCTALQTIAIPKTVSHIGSNSFENCVSLMSITIESEDEVTISTNAFKDCVALESIIAPKNMIIIKNAFYNCKNLQNVYSMSDVVNTSWKYRESAYGSDQSEYQGDDDYFTKATKYYYSDTTPAIQDKYWHYSSNGFKISCDDDLMIDSRYFKVSSDGEITANSGFIGGCTISSNSLSTSNGKFSVNSAGYLTAKSGKIGGFYIETSGISSNYKKYDSDLLDGVYIGSEGIALGKGVFKVDKTGSLTATNANITGAITATSGSFSGTINAKNGTIGSLSISNSVITGSYSESDNSYAYTIKPGLIQMGNIKITSTGVESTGSILRLGDYAEGSSSGAGIGISTTNKTITLVVGNDTGLRIRHTGSGGGDNAFSGKTTSFTIGEKTLTFVCGILTNVS